MSKTTLVKCVCLVVISFILIGLVPVPPQTITAAPPMYSASRVIVDKNDTVTLAELAKSGAVLLADYGSFTLWKLNPNQGQYLAPTNPLSNELDLIELRVGAINTVTGASPVAPNLQQPVTNQPQFKLVQFAGPIKDEWLKKLTDLGIDIVAYIPNNAFVVWLDGTELGKLQALVATDPLIQWVGDYHPAYRLSPIFQDDKNIAKLNTVEVTVQFYNTAQVNNSLATLQAMSGQIIEPAYPVLNLVNISLSLPANQLANVAAWSDVINVEPWIAPKKRDEVQNQIIAGNVTTSNDKVVPGGNGYLNWLNSKGFSTNPNNYPIVAVVDDGVENGDTNPLHPDFRVSGVSSNPSRLVFNANCTFDTSANGQGGHGTINAGIVAGFNNSAGAPYQDANNYSLGLGVSPYGRVGNVKIFSNVGYYSARLCENNYTGIVAAGYKNGARITNNSWGDGYFSYYTASSQAYDALTRDAMSAAGNQEMLHIFSAGNDGPYTSSVSPVASGKNVIAVGATENARGNGILDGCRVGEGDSADDLATFSSLGPTRDVRIKPDIVAPGTHVQGPASQTPGFNGYYVCGGTGSPYYPAGQTLYTWSSGTSHSAPAVAGAASLIHEYYGRVLAPGQTPSPAMTKALLLNTPRYLSGEGTKDSLPSNKQGWGGLNIGPLFDATTAHILVDQTTVFGNSGEVLTRVANIADPTKPLRVSLVWTDAPGIPSGKVFQNDLNLEVVSDGKVYKGNVFKGAFSANGGFADPRNNVENVFLPSGISGNIAVRITAANIVADGIPGNPDKTDQDFALVISNATPGSGAVLGTPGVSFNDTPPYGNANYLIEPNETIRLTIPLVNYGDLPASGISSTLAATKGDVTLLNNSSTYPNLEAGGRVNNTSSFSVLVNAAQICGGEINFTQTINYSGAINPFTYSFGFVTGTIGASVRYNSGDVPKAIPDNSPAGVVSTIPIANPIRLAKVSVRINDIRHEWIADLTLSLISPSGTSVNLAVNRGGSGNDFRDTVFDDSASLPISSGLAPLRGAYKPDSPLSVLKDEPANGNWQLKIIDSTEFDTGTLISWSLDIQSYVCKEPTAANYLHMVNPVRLYDSRPTGTNNPNPPLGVGTGELNPGVTRTIQVTGNAGVPAGATAVLANLTVANARFGGFLTAFPANLDDSNTAAVNWYQSSRGNGARTVSNFAIITLSPSGSFKVKTGGGSTNIIVDVFGYLDSNATGGGVFKPVNVANPRLYDSRPAGTNTPNPPLGVGAGALLKGNIRTIEVGGNLGVPKTATAVVVNVTAARTVQGGYFTLYPTGQPVPTVSSLNWTASNVAGTNVAKDVANLLIVPLGSGADAGKFNVTAGGNAPTSGAELIVDVVGYIDSAAGATSGFYNPLLVPQRLYDSRLGGYPGSTLTGPLTPLNQRSIQVGGLLSVPNLAKTAVVRISTVDTTGGGFLSLYPGPLYPGTSNINTTNAFQQIGNLAIVGLDETGAFIARNGHPNSTLGFVLDLIGYFS
jgi:subtilisin-like proprotein convertase family protein